MHGILLHHVWAGAPSCYLDLLDKLQKLICRIVGPSLAASFESLAHRKPLYRHYLSRYSSELDKLVPFPYSQGKSTCYSDRLNDFSVIIPRCYNNAYDRSFFPRLARLWIFCL